MPRGVDATLVEQQLENQKKKKALAEQAAKLVDVRMQIKGFDAQAWLIETLKYTSWLLIFTLSIFGKL